MQQQKQQKIQNWAKDFYIFSKKDTQMTNKHMRRCLRSLIIKEMQNKSKRYICHLIFIKMAIIKKTENSKC